MSLKNVVTNNIEKLLQRTSFMTLWIFVLLMFVATYYFLMEGVHIFLGDENFHIANAEKISEFFVLRNSSLETAGTCRELLSWLRLQLTFFRSHRLLPYD